MNSRIILGAVSVLAISSSATANLVIDRGLPTANLNNVSGANRSNVTWGFGQNPSEDYFSGDSFTLGSTGDPGNPTWMITKITTWTSGGSATDPNFALGDRFSNVRLFVGTNGLSEAAGGNFSLGSNSTDNSDISITKTTYMNGDSYQGTTGSMINLYKVEFSNLNIEVGAGDNVLFGVTGSARDNLTHTWFNHASNAALSGSTQQGSDDLYYYHTLSNLATGSGAWSSLGNGWDKASDINVLVEAQAVPEPATMTVLGLGLAAVAARRRRKNS